MSTENDHENEYVCIKELQAKKLLDASVCMYSIMPARVSCNYNTSKINNKQR
jgi:hypothetical protein